MKKFYKTASPALNGIGSLAMIFYAGHLFNRITETTGWAAVGMFLLGAALFGTGFFVFCKLDEALSRI